MQDNVYSSKSRVASVDLTEFDSKDIPKWSFNTSSDSVINAYELQLRKKGPEYAQLLSRAWTHRFAYTSSDGSNVQPDCVSAVESLTIFGVKPDRNFPNNGNFGDFTVSKEYLVKSVWSIHTLSNLQSSIADGFPVVFSTNLFSKTTDSLCAIGFDSVTKTIKCRTAVPDGDGERYKVITFDDFNEYCWDKWSFEIPDTVPVVDGMMTRSWYRVLAKIQDFFIG